MWGGRVVLTRSRLCLCLLPLCLPARLLLFLLGPPCLPCSQYDADIDDPHLGRSTPSTSRTTGRNTTNSTPPRRPRVMFSFDDDDGDGGSDTSSTGRGSSSASATPHIPSLGLDSLTTMSSTTSTAATGTPPLHIDSRTHKSSGVGGGGGIGVGVGGRVTNASLPAVPESRPPPAYSLDGPSHPTQNHKQKHKPKKRPAPAPGPALVGALRSSPKNRRRKRSVKKVVGFAAGSVPAPKPAGFPSPTAGSASPAPSPSPGPVDGGGGGAGSVTDPIVCAQRSSVSIASPGPSRASGTVGFAHGAPPPSAAATTGVCPVTSPDAKSTPITTTTTKGASDAVCPATGHAAKPGGGSGGCPVVGNVVYMSPRTAAASAPEPHIEQILAANPGAIACVDSIGTLLYVNRAFEDLTGFSAEEAVGKNCTIIIPQVYAEGHIETMARVVHGGTPRVIGKAGRQLLAVHKDGSRLPVLLALNRLEYGGRSYFLANIANIKDEAQHAAEVEEEDDRTHTAQRRILVQVVAALLLLLLLQAGAFLFGYFSLADVVARGPEVQAASELRSLSQEVAYVGRAVVGRRHLLWVVCCVWFGGGGGGGGGVGDDLMLTD